MFEIISFCFEAALWIRQRDDIVEFDIVEGSCLNVGFSMIAGVECKGLFSFEVLTKSQILS